MTTLAGKLAVDNSSSSLLVLQELTPPDEPEEPL